MDSTDTTAGTGPATGQQPPQPPSVATPDLGDVPLIFQCKSCRQLVGDTTAWWCALKNNRPGFALFAQHRNICVGTLTVTPECTYRDLACSACSEKLGQYMEVAPKDEPTLARKYVYHLDCVLISGLGGYVAEPEHELNRTALNTIPAPAATSEELHLMTYGIKELNKKVDYIIAKYVSKSHARHKQRVEAAVLAAGSANGLTAAVAPVPDSASTTKPATAPQLLNHNQQQQPPQSTVSSSRKSSVALTASSNVFAAKATTSTLSPGSNLTQAELMQFRAQQSASGALQSVPRSVATNGSLSASTTHLTPTPPAPPASASAASHLLQQRSTPPALAPTTAAGASASAADLSHVSVYRPPTPGTASHVNYVPVRPPPTTYMYPAPPPPSNAAASAYLPPPSAPAPAAAVGAPGLTQQHLDAFYAHAAAASAIAKRHQQQQQQQQQQAGASAAAATLSGPMLPPPATVTGGSAGVGAGAPATKRQKTGVASAVVTGNASNAGEASGLHKMPQAAAGAGATAPAVAGPPPPSGPAVPGGGATAAGASSETAPAMASGSAPTGTVPLPTSGWTIAGLAAPSAPAPSGKKEVEVVTIDDDDD